MLHATMEAVQLGLTLLNSVIGFWTTCEGGCKNA